MEWNKTSERKPKAFLRLIGCVKQGYISLFEICYYDSDKDKFYRWYGAGSFNPEYWCEITEPRGE